MRLSSNSHRYNPRRKKAFEPASAPRSGGPANEPQIPPGPHVSRKPASRSFSPEIPRTAASRADTPRRSAGAGPFQPADTPDNSGSVSDCFRRNVDRSPRSAPPAEIIGHRTSPPATLSRGINIASPPVHRQITSWLQRWHRFRRCCMIEEKAHWQAMIAPPSTISLFCIFDKVVPFGTTTHHPESLHSFLF